MAQTLKPSTDVDLKAFIERSTEESRAMQDATVHILEAESLFDTFKQHGANLQKDWHPDRWSNISDTVRSFCKVAQRITMTAGGLQTRVFDDATDVLTKFASYAEELLAEASDASSLPNEEILNRILGVVERCKIRTRELQIKRDDITIYRQKITELTRGS